MAQEKDSPEVVAAERMLRESYVANGGDPSQFYQWDGLRKRSEQVAFMWENGVVDRIPRQFLRQDHVEAILRLIGLRK